MSRDESAISIETMPCTVITPQRAVFTGGVTRLQAAGTGGTFEILPRHEPVMTPLAIGLLELVTPAGTAFFAVPGGFLDMDGERITVLADAAERANELDMTRAQSALARARARLEAVSGPVEDVQKDIDRAQPAILRPNLRLRAFDQTREQT